MHGLCWFLKPRSCRALLMPEHPAPVWAAKPSTVLGSPTLWPTCLITTMPHATSHPSGELYCLFEHSDHHHAPGKTAACGDRTHDRTLTKRMLYHLSDGGNLCLAQKGPHDSTCGPRNISVHQ